MNERPDLVGPLTLLNAVVLAFALLEALVFHRLDATVASLGQTGHWSSGQRDLVIVDKTGDRRWQQATQWAVARWNEAGAGVRLSWEAGRGPCRPEGVRIAVCLRSSEELRRQGPPRAEGLAKPQLGDNSHIDGATVLVCSDCGLDLSRRRVVATHEVGHTLGLHHSGDLGALMSNQGGSEYPDRRAYATLRAIYAHEDRT